MTVWSYEKMSEEIEITVSLSWVDASIRKLINIRYKRLRPCDGTDIKDLK